MDSTATEDGQAASPSALADRKGIWQGSLDCPTRKRRKRLAPLACATATLNKYSRFRGKNLTWLRQVVGFKDSGGELLKGVSKFS